jgi:hypothetical protein
VQSKDQKESRRKLKFQKGQTPKGAKPFRKGKSGNPKGREPGPNRATVFKRLLELKVDVADPESGAKKKVTLYEAAALGQVKSAMSGNTPAWKEIQDSLFGKQTVNLNLSPDELKSLTDKELDDLISQFSR